MNETTRKKTRDKPDRSDGAKNAERQNKLARAAEQGALCRLLNAYLQSCRSPDGEDGKSDGKARGERFPNLAGFCRYLRCGVSAAEELRQSHPDLYDHVCAVMEDEALNSKVSPTLLSVYLKRRLGYGEKAEAEGSDSGGQLKLIFEHDIGEDGA